MLRTLLSSTTRSYSTSDKNKTQNVPVFGVTDKTAPPPSQVVDLTGADDEDSCGSLPDGTEFRQDVPRKTMIAAADVLVGKNNTSNLASSTNKQTNSTAATPKTSKHDDMTDDTHDSAECPLDAKTHESLKRYWQAQFPALRLREKWTDFDLTTQGPIGALFLPQDSFQGAMLERVVPTSMWCKCITAAGAKDFLEYSNYTLEDVGPEPLVERPFTDPQMQVLRKNYGIHGYLDEYLQLPALVKRNLVHQCPEMGKILVGTTIQHLDERQGLYDFLQDCKVTSCSIFTRNQYGVMTSWEIELRYNDDEEDCIVNVKEETIAMPVLLKHMAEVNEKHQVDLHHTKESDKTRFTTETTFGSDDAEREPMEDDSKPSAKNHGATESMDTKNCGEDYVDKEDNDEEQLGITTGDDAGKKRSRACAVDDSDSEEFESVAKCAKVFSVNDSDSEDEKEDAEMGSWAALTAAEEKVSHVAGTVESPLLLTPKPSPGTCLSPTEDTAIFKEEATDSPVPLLNEALKESTNQPETRSMGLDDIGMADAAMQDATSNTASKVSDSVGFWGNFRGALFPFFASALPRRQETDNGDGTTPEPQEELERAVDEMWNSLLEAAESHASHGRDQGEEEPVETAGSIVQEEVERDGQEFSQNFEDTQGDEYNQEEEQQEAQEAPVEGGVEDDFEDEIEDEIEDDLNSFLEEGNFVHHNRSLCFRGLVRLLCVLALCAVSCAVGWHAPKFVSKAWMSLESRAERRAIERFLDFTSVETGTVASVVAEIGNVLAESDTLFSRLADFRQSLDDTLNQVEEAKAPFEHLEATAQVWDSTLVDLRYAVSVYVASVYVERLTALSEKAHSADAVDSAGLPLVDNGHSKMEEWKRQVADIADQITLLELTYRQLSKDAAGIRKERSTHYLWA